MTALRPATAPVEVRDKAENYGIDADRVLAVDGLVDWVRRRISGRYAVDEFGGDPHLIDLVSRLGAPIRVDVTNAEHLPRSGPALLIANRGLGLVEPLVLGFAVRRAARRRLRVIGAPEVPVLGPPCASSARSVTDPTTSPRCCGPGTWPPRRSPRLGCATAIRGLPARPT